MSIKSELDVAYRKSGLRKLVERYKSQYLGGSAGALGGVGLALATGANPLAGLALGGLAGGVAGYSADRDRRHRIDAQKEYEQRLRSQNQTRTELGDLLEGIGGRTNTPTDRTGYTTPGITRGSYTPAIPSDTQGSQPDPFEQPFPTTGARQETSAAALDAKRLLEEAEYQKQLGLEQRSTRDDERAQYLSELSQLLSQRQERQLGEIRPEVYEELNTRGLLRSSALGDRLARERAKLEAGTEEQLALQALQDRGASLNELMGVQNQYLGGRQQALARQLSLEDYVRQVQASQKLGQVLTPVQNTYSGKNTAQHAQAGLGAAGSVAGLASLVR